MKKNQSKREKKNEDTLDSFFQIVDSVVKKAERDKSSQKLIDSAVRRWESDCGYAL